MRTFEAEVGIGDVVFWINGNFQVKEDVVTGVIFDQKEGTKFKTHQGYTLEEGKFYLKKDDAFVKIVEEVTRRNYGGKE